MIGQDIQYIFRGGYCCLFVELWSFSTSHLLNSDTKDTQCRSCTSDGCHFYTNWFSGYLHYIFSRFFRGGGGISYTREYGNFPSIFSFVLCSQMSTRIFPGEAQLQSNPPCERCPAGTYTNEGGRTECKPCPGPLLHECRKYRIFSVRASTVLSPREQATPPSVNIPRQAPCKRQLLHVHTYPINQFVPKDIHRMYKTDIVCLLYRNSTIEKLKSSTVQQIHALRDSITSKMYCMSCPFNVWLLS